MRKFKFFALAFAALSFAACSDDAIDGQGGNTGVSSEETTPAYLTIAFSANSGSSSRADREDINTGDKDGVDVDNDGTTDGAEDSGHHNNGEDAENKVHTALVVIVPNDGETGGSYFAKLYSATAGQGGTGTTPPADLEDGTSTNVDGDEALTVIQESTYTYSTDRPITVTATETGIDYKVLVVVNPVASLTDDITDIRGGITTEETVQNLYNTITTGNYKDDSDGNTYITAASSIGDGTSGFMMANREECITTVKTSNDADHPALADLDVERVLSKITFRPKMNGGNPNYIYEVNSTIGSASFKAEVKRGAFDINDDGVEGEVETTPSPYTHVGNFNKATDLYGQHEIWVLFDDEDDSFVGVYKLTSETTTVGEETGLPIFKRLTPKTQDEYNAIAADNDEDTDISNYYVAKVNDGTPTTYDEENSFTLELDPNAPSTGKKFYAKLEGYALINLSNKVNYVRHRIPVGGAAETPFGLLLGKDYYLWTPDWEAKNNVVFETETSLTQEEIEAGKVVGDFENENIANSWFYNTIKQVSDESKTLTVSSGSVSFADKNYFKDIDDIEADEEQDVTNVGGGTSHNGTNNNLADIGYQLGYCFENSVEKDMQKHGLTTGIAFVATMWEDANCSTTPLEKLYRYSGYVFETLTQLVSAYAGNVDDKIIELANKEAGGNEFDAEDLEYMQNLGIDRYEGNICYYYSTEIKHYDNGEDDDMGVMEFAIMRNNIYSLSISSINDIGDPFIEPTPGIDNESQEAALRIQAEIVPWIVRYNDIEF